MEGHLVQPDSEEIIYFFGRPKPARLTNDDVLRELSTNPSLSTDTPSSTPVFHHDVEDRLNRPSRAPAYEVFPEHTYQRLQQPDIDEEHDFTPVDDGADLPFEEINHDQAGEFEIVENRRRRGGNGLGTQIGDDQSSVAASDSQVSEQIEEKLRPTLRNRVSHPTTTGGWYDCGGTSNLIRKYFREQRTAPEDVKGDNSAEWMSRSEIPSAAELFDECPALIPENNVDTGHQDHLHYLACHYNFFREEAVKPLRDAITTFRNGPYMMEPQHSSNGMGIYNKVFITALTFSKRGIGIKVVFSLGKVGKNIKWDQSKRLITGSLVALSRASDMFCDAKRTVVAVIAARPLDQLRESPPQVDLFIVQPMDFEIDSSTEWVMLEARASFFEAQRHTMLALQKLSHEKFPLADHLVHLREKVAIPDYVAKEPHRNLSSIFPEGNDYDSVDLISNWPENPPTTLDATQLGALQRILTKQLALVQGPPGTGKTFVSVIAVKVILAAMSHGDGPVIISCQTNHALDQLLRRIAESYPDCFARLGGRSKDTTGIIQSRTLFELKKKEQTSRSAARNASRVLEGLGREMSRLLEPLERGKSIGHKVLKDLGLLTQAHCDTLERGDPRWENTNAEDAETLESWVGDRYIDLKKDRDFELEKYGNIFEEAEIETEQLAELEAENRAADEEDDIERLKGHVIPLMDKWKASERSRILITDEDFQRMLDKTQDIWDIKPTNRGSIYAWLGRQAKLRIRDKVRTLALQYQKASKEWQISKFEDDLKVLSKQRIIGMTTTGLSKYRGLISSLKPKVVLIEEAGETLEAPVAAACLDSIEHLILVGDHRQLRPHCVFQEHEQLGWNVSLFERLVDNGVEFSMLQRQRRMIPEIRRILGPIYGDQIRDHPDMHNVIERPAIEGMGGVNSYFFTHDWPEQRNDQMSTENEHEAEMIVGFVDYLVKNGMRKDQITVLTFYNGQRSLILRKLNRHIELGIERTKTFTVATVDSYQGEENDVVILSTVRSNDNGNIGFLSNDNRVCVALSRAKRGFYIFGNATALGCESSTWSEVIKIMAGRSSKDIDRNEMPEIMPRRVGFYLPICCSRHGHTTFIQTLHDWDKINGGCESQCKAKLPCGHDCPLKCHSYGEERVRCQATCDNNLPCGHKCQQLCGEMCACNQCDLRGDGRIITTSSGSNSNQHLLLQPTSAANPLNLVHRPKQNEMTGRPSRGQGTEQRREGSNRGQNKLMTSLPLASDVLITPSPDLSGGSINCDTLQQLTQQAHEQRAVNEWQAYSNGGMIADDKRLSAIPNRALKSPDSYARIAKHGPKLRKDEFPVLPPPTAPIGLPGRNTPASLRLVPSPALQFKVTEKAPTTNKKRGSITQRATKDLYSQSSSTPRACGTKPSPSAVPSSIADGNTNPTKSNDGHGNGQNGNTTGGGRHWD